MHARAVIAPSCIFVIETWYRVVSVASSERLIRNVGVYIWDRARAVSLKRSPCQEEVWRRERDLPWPLLLVSGLRSREPYSTPIDSRSSWCHGALSRRVRRGVNSYATRYLHYHISDAICSRELMHSGYFLPPRISSGTYRAHCR